MGEVELGRFLSSLARDGRVSSSTQNQALNGILFLYGQVLGKDIGLLDGVARAKRPARLPVVLTREEVSRALGCMTGAPRLMAMLLYGAGLRLMECCRLRVKDVDFSQNQIVVRAGKGDKDRCTMLPATAKDPLLRHLDAVRWRHQDDLSKGLGSVALPGALSFHAAFLRDPLAGGRIRYTNYPGVARAPRRLYDDDLYACFEPWRAGSEEPCRQPPLGAGGAFGAGGIG